jgi:leucyl aminopeptidase
MPLGDGYREALESDIADLRQCSSATRQPDACHAATFLHHFVRDTKWAHLDIAGVESQETATDRHAAGPTGWGVRLLDRLVADRFEDPG